MRGINWAKIILFNKDDVLSEPNYQRELYRKSKKRLKQSELVPGEEGAIRLARCGGF